MALTGQIVTAEIDPAEEDEVRSGRATERDENQLLLDGMVGELKAEWEAKGKPTLNVLRTKPGFKAAGKRSIVVSGDDKSTAKAMIRRAATLHKVTPVFANDKVNDDGTVRIKWTVGPYVTRVRNTAPTTPKTPDADTVTPTGDSAGEQDTGTTAADSEPSGDGTPDDAASPAGRRGRNWGGR